MPERSDDMAPDDAVKRVDDVTRRLARYRHIYVGWYYTIGLLTVGFFLLVALVPHEVFESYSLFFVLLPVALYYALRRFREAGGNQTKVLQVERRLISLYTAGLLAAIAIVVFLIGTKSWVAAIPALLPASVCFAGGWWFARNT